MWRATTRPSRAWPRWTRPARCAARCSLAVVDDEPWAALALDDGRVVADPFRPSAIAVELLRLRARHLSAATGERRAARHGLRLPRRASA